MVPLSHASARPSTEMRTHPFGSHPTSVVPRHQRLHWPALREPATPTLDHDSPIHPDRGSGRGIELPRRHRTYPTPRRNLLFLHGSRTSIARGSRGSSSTGSGFVFSRRPIEPWDRLGLSRSRFFKSTRSSNDRSTFPRVRSGRHSPCTTARAKHPSTLVLRA